jgi:hypothetical protein
VRVVEDEGHIEVEGAVAQGGLKMRDSDSTFESVERAY